jgi:hypothetical protein
MLLGLAIAIAIAALTVVGIAWGYLPRADLSRGGAGD